jgi:hypothetical protein
VTHPYPYCVCEGAQSADAAFKRDERRRCRRFAANKMRCGGQHIRDIAVLLGCTSSLVYELLVEATILETLASNKHVDGR